MKIKQVCCCKGHNYNILPAILVTPKEDGFIVALKWWTFHVGVYFWQKPKQKDHAVKPRFWKC